MTGLLNGETVTLEGRYFTVKNASLRTVVPHVPGLGRLRVARRCSTLTARYGHGWNMAGGGTDPAAIQEKYDGFSAACAARRQERQRLRRLQDDVHRRSRRTTPRRSGWSRSWPSRATCRPRRCCPTGDRHAGRPGRAAADPHRASGSPTTSSPIAESDEWPNYWDAVELVAKEVVPRVKA